MSEVQKPFSMEDLRKRVEENAVATMGMLMPEEALRELVMKAIDRFFTAQETFEFRDGHVSGYGWESRKTPSKHTIVCSNFELMVWTAISPIVKKHLADLTGEIDTEMTETLAKARDEVSEKIRVSTISAALEVAPEIQKVKMLEAMNVGISNLTENIRSVMAQHRMDISQLQSHGRM